MNTVLIEFSLATGTITDAVSSLSHVRLSSRRVRSDPPSRWLCRSYRCPTFAQMEDAFQKFHKSYLWNARNILLISDIRNPIYHSSCADACRPRRNSDDVVGCGLAHPRRAPPRVLFGTPHASPAPIFDRARFPELAERTDPPNVLAIRPSDGCHAYADDRDCVGTGACYRVFAQRLRAAMRKHGIAHVG